MAKRRSVIDLVQTYMADQGAETKGIIDEINAQPSLPDGQVVELPDPLTVTQQDNMTAIPKDSHGVTLGSSNATAEHDSIAPPQRGSNTTAQQDSITVEQQDITQPVDIITDPPTLPDGRVVQLQDPITVGQPNSGTVSPPDTPTATDADAITTPQHSPDTLGQQYSVTPTPQEGITPAPQDGVTMGALYRMIPLPADSQGVAKGAPLLIPLEVLKLSCTQAWILHILINISSRLYNKRFIKENTQLPDETIKDAIRRLEKKGFMTTLETIRNADYQGNAYMINEDLCTPFMNLGGVHQEQYKAELNKLMRRMNGGRVGGPPDGQTVQQLNRQTNVPSNGGTPPYPNHQAELQDDSSLVHSSRFVLKSLKEPTTYDQQAARQSGSGTTTPPELGTFILTGKLGEFWRKEEEPLTEGQVQQWCEECKVTPAKMRESLEYAAFDLEFNGKRAEVKKTSMYWAYHFIVATAKGDYCRPPNFRSQVEIEAEEYRQQQDRDAAAREILRAKVLVNKFQEFLTEQPEPLYKNLLDDVLGKSSFMQMMWDSEGVEGILDELKTRFISHLKGDDNWKD